MPDCAGFWKLMPCGYNEIAIVCLGNGETKLPKFRKVLERTLSPWGIGNATGTLDINESFQGEMSKIRTRGSTIIKARLTPQKMYS